MGTPTLVCVWSCPNFSALAGGPFRCVSDIWLLISGDAKDVYPVFVGPEISTQADGAQSSQVPIPLPEDPYEAIRKAYLDGTDTKSEPFKDPVDTETPDLPLTVAPPTSLPESTPPVLVPILCRTACMVVRVPPAMSPGLSASMAKVAATSESAFRKRFRSSYESLTSLSPPDLPSRKRYRVTSELVDDNKEDDEEEDEEIEESLDFDSVSEDAEDKGPTVEDEDLVTGDEGLAVGDEGPSIGVESCGSNDESHGLDNEGHSIESDGLGLGEDEEVVPGHHLLGHPPSHEWSSGFTSVSLRILLFPSPISSPMILLTVPSPVATPAMAKTRGILTELGAQVQMQRGLIRDHAVWLEELSLALFERYDKDIGELFTRLGAVRDEIFSQRYRFRSLKHEQERVAVNFGALWRPMLALESWAGQTDAQKAALWHAISDVQGKNRELRL
ncbi:hypothetical protein Tco_1503508 [Tanacetum coccineum]